MGIECSKCEYPCLPKTAQCLKCLNYYCNDCIDIAEIQLSNFVWNQIKIIQNVSFLPLEMWTKIHQAVLVQEIEQIVKWKNPIRLKVCWECIKDKRLIDHFNISTSTPIGQ